MLLDALGTLVDLEPPAPRLRAELRARFGLAVSLEQAERAIAAEIAYYRSHLNRGRDERALAELRSRCADVLAQELGDVLGAHVPAGPAMVEALLASLSFRTFPDVGPALGELHALGLRLVVVSNWDVSLAGVLEGLGLSDWLTGVVSSAEVGVGKPNPAALERGLAVAGVAAAEAMHVGDSPREDVAGARAAGIEPVLLSRRGAPDHSVGPGALTIASLGELVPLARQRAHVARPGAAGGSGWSV